ncbi:hypothetical protein ACGF12_34190 [Kitasatospora sp. NPDC048296]|uniref:hypothetical protein n=1 Tax=Kitasatospora sp. NPDC048296 TaxID=3364048 RepID=UPI003717BA6C
MNEKPAGALAWRRSAAPVVATAVLVVATVTSWLLFQREQPCWGKGPGRVVAAFGATGLGILGLLALAVSWVVARGSESRGAALTAALLATLTVLSGLGMVFLGQPAC